MTKDKLYIIVEIMVKLKIIGMELTKLTLKIDLKNVTGMVMKIMQIVILH